MTAEEGSFRHVRSADRTLDLLELMAGQPEGIGFNEIVGELGLPKSSLSGLLRTLMARRYVTRTADGRRYQLGMKVLELSGAYLHDGAQLEQALQAMRQVRDELGETTHIAVLDGADVIYVATEASQHSVRITIPLGQRIPAHTTAVGKSMLACLGDDEIDALLAPRLTARTNRSITVRADLKRELVHIRRLGYAYDAEEFTRGLHCIGAPICDAQGRPIAGISVSVPLARLGDLDVRRLPELVQRAAAAASRLGAAALPWRPQRVRVAWSIATLHVQSYQIMYREIERLCVAGDADVVWADAKDSPEKQVADVANLLLLKPDVIIIHAVHTMLADQLFRMAAEAKVPAIAFQRPTRSRDFDFFIGGDTYQAARITTRFVTQELRGRGGVAIIGGDPYNDNARNLAQGTLDELAAYPGIEIIANLHCPFWSREKAYEIAVEVLQEHEARLNAFIVANDDMAGGVAKALSERGCAGKILLLGGDGDLDALERMRAGTQHGTAFQNWLQLAQETLRFAVDAAHGRVDRSQLQRRSIFFNPPGPLEYVKDLPYTFVDRSNMEVLDQFWRDALSIALPDLLPTVAAALSSPGQSLNGG